MILVALGSNMSGPWGTPSDAIRMALDHLDRDGLHLKKVSKLILTTPFGRINQPDFVNAAAVVETHLPPESLMRRLHAIEREAGRRRGVRWGPRTLDLDLIDYKGLLKKSGPILPHPGIAERTFVLEPILELAPRWRHPVTRRSAKDMLRSLSGH
ncbi:MAG: 2-amino-4-hydroxy-6-hydroxymethyldihydropteridine diphosphokinase [Aestuariivirga sp.]